MLKNEWIDQFSTPLEKGAAEAFLRTLGIDTREKGKDFKPMMFWHFMIVDMVEAYVKTTKKNCNFNNRGYWVEEYTHPSSIIGALLAALAKFGDEAERQLAAIEEENQLANEFNMLMSTIEHARFESC